MSFGSANEHKLEQLEIKCRFFLTEVKKSDKKLWNELVDSFNDVEIEELPKWFIEAKAKYNEK